METQEITRTKVNCVECSKLFSCIRYLKTHMKLIHAKSESNTIDCKDCEEKFTSESDLKIHQYFVHPFLKFACEKCDKRFISKHSFNLHQQVLQLNQDEKQNSSETNIILVKQELRDHSPNRYNSEGHSKSTYLCKWNQWWKKIQLFSMLKTFQEKASFGRTYFISPLRTLQPSALGSVCFRQPTIKSKHGKKSVPSVKKSLTKSWSKITSELNIWVWKLEHFNLLQMYQITQKMYPETWLLIVRTETRNSHVNLTKKIIKILLILPSSSLVENVTNDSFLNIQLICMWKWCIQIILRWKTYLKRPLKIWWNGKYLFSLQIWIDSVGKKESYFRQTSCLKVFMRRSRIINMNIVKWHFLQVKV